MLRWIISIFIVLTLPASTPAYADEPSGWTQTGSCYWVRGRMRAYNGSPTFRIWPRGTNRLLGVVGDKRDMEAWDKLPPVLRKLEPSFGTDIWANFRVCPVSPERAGWMRFVFLKDAKVLAVVQHTP